MEGTFFGFEEEIEISQALQDLRNVVAMFSHAPGVDEDIINVDKDGSMEILPENLMHEVLEYEGGIY